MKKNCNSQMRSLYKTPKGIKLILSQLIVLFILISTNCNAQLYLRGHYFDGFGDPSLKKFNQWEVKDYLDDFGDPSGVKYLVLYVIGSSQYYGKFYIEILRPLDSKQSFSITVYTISGKPANPSNNSCYSGKCRDVLRYKTTEKEDILYSDGCAMLQYRINIDYAPFQNLLLSGKNPIKCILSVESEVGFGSKSYTDLYSFTLYTTNYRQLTN
jgi:hypothetical protein